ncbi:insulinase family protein [Xylanibacter brevis]|uniref:insulinase family protein n=1 Tax=Xylanibacter brevis TaxID=83231 RepID=UPI00047F2CC4|nr:insulinase family protein [Xylanibacter brevis]
MMKTKLFLFSVVFCFAIQVLAQSENVRYEDFLVTDSSNIYQGILDNGFRYYICNNNRPGNELEMRLIQKSGTDDDVEAPGISLLLKRMLASENLSVGTDGMLKNRLEGLKLERKEKFWGLTPGVPAYHSEIDNRCTEFCLFQLKKEQAYVASCMDLLSAIGGAAHFSESELEHQKELLVNEITNGTYDLSKAESDGMIAMFVEGTTLEEKTTRQIESIRRITLQQLEAYYQKWYIPQNQCLYVFGKAPANVVDMIKQKFGNRPSAPAPESNVKALSDKKLLFVKSNNPECVVKFFFVQPCDMRLGLATLDDLRQSISRYRYCDILKLSFMGTAMPFVEENNKYLERPVFGLTCKKGLDPYASKTQFTDFIDNLAKKLDNLIHDGIQINIDSLPAEKLKEQQQKVMENLPKYVVLDTHSMIKNNFVYSSPLLKMELAYNYFFNEVSAQEMMDYGRAIFKDYDLRIVCSTPYGYPDADIKAKLESVLQHFEQMEK